MDEFEIYPEEIASLRNAREFEIWLNAIDSVICFENIDNLIEYLITIDRPDFVLEAIKFKKQYDL